MVQNVKAAAVDAAAAVVAVAVVVVAAAVVAAAVGSVGRRGWLDFVVFFDVDDDNLGSVGSVYSKRGGSKPNDDDDTKVDIVTSSVALEVLWDP